MISSYPLVLAEDYLASRSVDEALSAVSSPRAELAVSLIDIAGDVDAGSYAVYQRLFAPYEGPAQDTTATVRIFGF